jgi:glutamine amidotransferase
MKVGVINYGIGNVNSIINFLKRLRIDAISIDIPELMSECSIAILPGVGSFDNATSLLCKTGFDKAIMEFALNDANTLVGICLGMQLLGKGSEEGNTAGLNLIEMYSRKFDSTAYPKLQIPNIGWRSTEFLNPNMHTLNSFNVKSKFYHVHSYYVDDISDNYVISRSFHGHDFVNGINKDNIWGFQFHPEKSHLWGELLFYILLREII